MNYPESIPVEAMHNLASWIHHDSIAHNILLLTCPAAMGSLVHYTRMGSKYCPRVLLACEQMLRSFYKNNTIDDYVTYTATPHPDAFIPVR